ncbi:MAG: DUF4190 domain-containing protein [Nocardioidaceae bacterium]
MSYPPPPPPGYPIYPQRTHPHATTALVLGILGLVVCGILAPFALSIGHKAVREIDQSNGALGGRGSANAGYILGIIGTVLLAIAILFLITAVAVSTSGARS